MTLEIAAIIGGAAETTTSVEQAAAAARCRAADGTLLHKDPSPAVCGFLK